MRWSSVIVVALLGVGACLHAQEINLPPASVIRPPADVESPEEETAAPAPEPAVVEPRARPSSDAQPLRIAHLMGTDEIPLGSGGFAALRAHLERDTALLAALRAAGRGPVRVIGTDDHVDLRQRMDASEFDLVFAPTLVQLLQRGEYEVLGQVRTSATHGATGRGGLTQTGVIFVNSTHPLFALGEGEANDPLQWIATRPMAVVSASSAVGYVFPLVTLQAELETAEDPPLLFCSSAEEAVMAVLNNLAWMGACDETTFNRVAYEFADDPDGGSIVREVAHTQPIPVAPIVMRRDLLGTPVADALVSALDGFLESLEGEPAELVRLSDTRQFDQLQSRVDHFYEARRRE